jgi:prepilin-type N-terminal cleavage/methylation domain-containing protein
MKQVIKNMADENNNLRLLSFLKEKRFLTDDAGKTPNQHGVSLVELVVVILIIAIIATIALLNIATPKKQLTRQNVAQELKSAFERARFDSVKRRAEIDTINNIDYRASVTVNETSFILVTDVNQDGDVADAADSLTTNFSADGVAVTSTTLTLPVTVYFNKRGEVINSAGSSMSPTFLVCNPSCAVSNGNSNANSSNANLVLVTPTGTVNLLSGGSSVPTFATPNNNSNVTSTTDIKSSVIANAN